VPGPLRFHPPYSAHRNW